jgi:imidazole glycerol-phosphate synthase subunit HisH
VIAVVDVCSGNLRSVEKALAAVGGEVVVTRDPDTVRKADKVVVPGQGAFGAFTRGLAERELEAPLREVIARGTPYLGICLGLQVLFDESEEQGPQRGLGLVPGKVVRFAAAPGLKVPHMGWNTVARRRPDPLGDSIADGAHVYFVHSYHVVPADPSVIVMTSEHGAPFCAAIRKDNVFAVQFHPEKSQRIGLALLEAFAHA